MYEYVENVIIKPYRSVCANILTSLRDKLYQECEIDLEFILIGSGAKNMVTRNGDGPFDLDYNLIIKSAPENYWNDMKTLKEKIRTILNSIVRDTSFSDGKDSTSVITSILHFNDSPEKEFSFDIAIMKKNEEGNYERLMHIKDRYGNSNNDQYIWRETPNSKNIKNKEKLLKNNGFWNEARDLYLNKKNMYLSRMDKEHTSSVVYIETINEVYSKLR